MEFAECGQGWLDEPCKHESSIQDCIQCLCKHGHARDCGEMDYDDDDDNCFDCGVNAEEESIDYGICTDCSHSVCTDCQGDLHRNGRRDDNARCGTSERVL